MKKSVCSCGFVIKSKTRKGGYETSVTADATSNQPNINLVSKSSDKMIVLQNVLLTQIVYFQNVMCQADI